MDTTPDPNEPEAAPPFRHVFGPVPSRRLGRSLGVDLVPFKTCTYDCVYCQLGATTEKTVERKAYVPVEEVLAEVERKLRTGSSPDYVTLSGSGEPTLHSQVGEVIDGIKKLTEVPVAVLTNGSLLWMESVRRALTGADLVVPSLDAGDEQTFRRVNRPASDVSFDRMVQGLRDFAKEYKGKIWLEVFLLEGVTTDPEQVRRIAAIAKDLSPEHIQLNTVARPPAYASARPVSLDRLRQLAGRFTPVAEVVVSTSSAHNDDASSATESDILAMIRRRPCSAQDIASGLGVRVAEVLKYLVHLSANGLAVTQRMGDVTFYTSPIDEPH